MASATPCRSTVAGAVYVVAFWPNWTLYPRGSAGAPRDLAKGTLMAVRGRLVEEIR